MESHIGECSSIVGQKGVIWASELKRESMALNFDFGLVKGVGLELNRA